MRVVSGEFGGRRLVTPEGHATRPTTDKVRQAVFNSLDSAGLVDGAAVADLYAGSGALGIEALSRGAATCVFVERERSALAALRENLTTLGLEGRGKVVTGDALAQAAALRGIDLVLVDPPYRFDQWPELLAAIGAPTVVAESDHEVDAPDGWESTRGRRYGRTFITVLRRIT